MMWSAIIDILTALKDGGFRVMLPNLLIYVYDGDFKVLAWLPFPSDVLPAPLLKAWCVTAKALPDISAISALIAVKHGNYSSLTPPLQPVRTQKIH